MAEITLTSRLELRLTDAEKDLYQRAAERDGRPLSNWIRDRLNKAANSELPAASRSMAKGGGSSAKPRYPAAGKPSE
jgi:uncharacterized protein (DUF1778 family)